MENRYHTDEVWQDSEGKPLHPQTAYWVGGNTKVYGAALFRLRERDFEEVQHQDGISPEWPLKYRDYQSYYDEAELLYQAHGERGSDPTEPPTSQPKASLLDLLVIVPALFAIIVGSRGLVNSTIWLAGRFSLPHATIEMLVIASLTGIPNAISAVHLSLHRRGAAVVTETFNSCTLNIVVGVSLPSLILGLGQVSTRTVFSLCWLFDISVVAILFTMRGGLRRIGGGVLLGLCAVFVAFIIFWH